MDKAAIIGAGRMGSIVARQLPDDVEKMIIDTEETKAKALADSVGAQYALTLDAAKDADIVAIVLPTPAVPPVAAALADVVKDGAIILNMATNGEVPASTIAARPTAHFVDAKIIGHAMSIDEGAPAYVIVNTDQAAILEKVRHILPGYTKVMSGDSSLVPKINTIGSSEGIRAAVNVRRLVKQYDIPRDWEDILIYTVCAGTMRAYVKGDLGEFAHDLAKRLEAED